MRDAIDRQDELQNVLRQLEELGQRDGPPSARIANLTAEIRETVARIRDARFDRDSFVRKEQELREEWMLLQVPSAPPLSRAMPPELCQRDMADLRKIKANLERFVKALNALEEVKEGCP